MLIYMYPSSFLGAIVNIYVLGPTEYLKNFDYSYYQDQSNEIQRVELTSL